MGGWRNRDIKRGFGRFACMVEFEKYCFKYLNSEVMEVFVKLRDYYLFSLFRRLYILKF